MITLNNSGPNWGGEPGDDDDNHFGDEPGDNNDGLPPPGWEPGDDLK